MLTKRRRPFDSRAEPYLAVEHQSQWFSIEQQDLASKEAFIFLNILTQLTSTQDGGHGPVVTIGAGN